MKTIWRAWKYAIGSFSDETTRPYDNRVAVIRTFWILLHIITCVAIIAGNGRTLGFW
jgi:hypothetical protein